MLALINAARTEAGLSAVVRGDNGAAQVHADNSLANCISSHWSIDGLTPDMRYSLAGGYQSANENVYGSDYCKLPNQGYSAISSVAGEVRKAMEAWMESPAHRDNILKPRQRKVNIGLAWDRFNFMAVQQFEGDFIEYTDLPEIKDDVLSMVGKVKNGANLEHGDHIRVSVLYNPQPQPLTRGQIARVYGSCLGRKVALLSYRGSGRTESTWKPCLSPYDVAHDAPAPTSASVAHELWEEARARYESLDVSVPITVARVRMSRWELDGDRFAVSADLGDVLEAHGPGVYQVVLFGVLDGDVEPISEHSIFHGIPRPSGYDSSTSTSTPTSANTPMPTATPTAEEIELNARETAPEHVVYAWWDWDYKNPLRNLQSALSEITVDVEIHNDIELAGLNGIYLMVCSGDVDGIGYYFGLQTDVYKPGIGGSGKGLIFSRWGTRDLANARIPGDGWTQSSGHEGDFIGVRRSYAWTAGKYRLRMGIDGEDDTGRWFSVWITDLTTNEETWIGSLRFPTRSRPSLIGPRCYNTVEVYGSPIAPSSIPYWRVTLGPPMGDGERALATLDGYSPFTGGFRNARFEYDESGAIVYEVGLDYIPEGR